MKHSKTLMAVLSLLAFGLVAAVSLSDSSVAFGRTIGAGNLAVFMLIFAGSVACSAAVWMAVMNKVTWSFKSAIGYFAFALCSSAPLSDRLISMASEKWGLAESVARAQVVYFCIDHYNAARCVSQLTKCPDCKRVMSLEQRRDLREKLTAFTGQLDQVAAAREAAQEPNGGPLTEAARKWREANRAPASK